MRKFDPDDLIDPAIDDPDDYFVFVTDGTIRLKDDLSADQVKRANETLRVFHLDESAYLRKSREDAVKPYKNIMTLLITSTTPDVVHAYVQSEKSNVGNAPFSAAIRQFFMSYCP